MSDTNLDIHKTQQPMSKHSLGKFIDEHQRLISVLGVFTAITVFTANLPFRPVGYALSFVFLALTLIIWTELLERFPKGLATWRLYTFEILLSYSVLGVFLYWLLAYRDIWHSVMRIALLIIFLTVLATLLAYPLKKFQLLDKLKLFSGRWSKVLRYVVFFSIIILAYIISSVLAIILAPPLNEALDSLRNTLDGSILK